MTCKINIKNKRSRLHREAEEMLICSREGGKIGCGELAMALRDHDSFCSRPLSDRELNLFLQILHRNPVTRPTLPWVIGL